MATPHLPTVLRLARAYETVPDAQLLGRFVEAGDEAAFELLVWRHGPAVLAACRRVLRHHQDAEDAFQATFLTLARKAGTVARRGAVGGWLRRVAVRAAVAAKTRAARRPAAAGELGDVPAAPEPAAGDLRAVLDDEVGRLPALYRVPFLLCHRDGLTVDEAARRLGRPRGTVGTRVARAKARLRERLAARGVAPAAAAVLVASAEELAAEVPAALAATTVRLARAGPGAAPAPILTLSDGVTRAMFLSQLKAGLAAAVAVAVLGAGVLTLGPAAADAQPPATPPAAAQPPAAPAGKLTLRGWGTATDPDGDCKFVLDRGALSITVPGSDHALAAEHGRMNAPRVLRAVEGDFIAQVRVSADYPAGATSLVAARRPFHGAGLLVWQDAKTYVRLERAELVFEGKNYSYGSFELRKDGEFVRPGAAEDLTLDGKTTYLRVERRGGTVYGSAGGDGVEWKALRPIEVGLGRRLLVGVTAGHNTSSAFTAAFDGFQVFQEQSEAGGR